MTLKNMIELSDGLTPIETEIGYYILMSGIRPIKPQSDVSACKQANRPYGNEQCIS